MNRPKIGFHTGPGGTPTGIGDFMKELDAEGIPFCIKGTDHAGVVYEGQELAAKSGVPHVLIYRRSGIGTYDTPLYELAAGDAALRHWNIHLSAWPQELDPSRVWMETVNVVGSPGAFVGITPIMMNPALIREIIKMVNLRLRRVIFN